MVHEVLPKLEAQVGSAPVLAIARALTPAFQQALLEGAVDLVGSVSGSCPGMGRVRCRRRVRCLRDLRGAGAAGGWVCWPGQAGSGMSRNRVNALARASAQGQCSASRKNTLRWPRVIRAAMCSSR